MHSQRGAPLDEEVLPEEELPPDEEVLPEEELVAPPEEEDVEPLDEEVLPEEDPPLLEEELLDVPQQVTDRNPSFPQPKLQSPPHSVTP